MSDDATRRAIDASLAARIGEAKRREYRAVFSYPPSILGATPDDYGPPRATRAEAERDYPPRAEETRGWLSGIQSREVTEWREIGA